MSDTSDPARAIAILTQDAPPRVWSFIVTIFGDLAQGKDDALSGRALARMAETAGLRPETVRVALHRLRKDGWIESRRDGRQSHYALTAFGRSQSAAAAARIYASHAPKVQSWTILVGNPDRTDDTLSDVASFADAVPLGNFGLLIPGEIPSGEDELLRLSARDVSIPAWLRGSVCSEDVQVAYRLLLEKLTRIEPMVGPGATGLSGATLRALLVHSWRRVLLRHPDLPPDLFPPGWCGEECRASVMVLLGRLPRPALSALEAEAVL